ncbi:hypothetical protein JOB18_022344 [Solea senegalensis]|uniref:L1 transposable element RRM domain-containing protein n=1 Tax=Solea senegalensis TaxID=28829 RepID=A0AAV6SZ97_SOLSE|nr:hypothetical protein JOB18_022344 [Solea senegalensis]
MMEAIKDIKGELLSHSRRIGEVEESVSLVEDDAAALQQKVGLLTSKIQDQEDRARRPNLRLVGLPEKTEGPDMCNFLENCLPRTLGETLTPAPVIERAHRIGQVNPNRPSTSRTIVMKLLNYRDRQKILRAARRLKEVRYENHRISFYPDLSAETRQLQRQFDGIKAQLRALNIRYGMLYPAHLVIKHNDQRLIFKSVPEAKD